MVKRIFKMIVEGYGIIAITKTLNQEKVPVIGRQRNCKEWGISTVSRILHNRAVLGEYTPHIKREGGRVATGDVISDYYPQIIDHELFHKVQAILSQRKIGKAHYNNGRVNNLFAGLLTAPNGSTWYFTEKGTLNARLICRSDIRGQSSYGTIRYPLFEQVVLHFLVNWTVQKPDMSDPTADALEAKRGELAMVTGRLERLQAKMEEADDLDTLIVAARNLETKKRTLNKEIEQLEQQEATGREDHLTTTKKLISTNPEDRAALRQAIANTVESIVVKTVKEGRNVHFNATLALKGYGATATVNSRTFLEVQRQKTNYHKARQ